MVKSNYKPQEYWTKRGSVYDEEWRKSSLFGIVSNLVKYPQSYAQARSVVSEIKLTKPKKVLECGCGTGRILKMLENNGFELYGVDFSKTMLATARRKISPKTVLVQADYTKKIPFPNNSFDTVYTCASLLHVPTKSIRGACKEIKRVSRKYIVLSEWVGDTTAMHCFNHDYEKLFSDCELVSKKRIPLIPDKFTFVFKKRK